MQGTLVQFLVWKDLIGQEATKPVGHNYWSLWALEPVLQSKRSHRSEKPTPRNWRVVPASPHLEKRPHSNKTQHSQKYIKLKRKKGSLEQAGVGASMFPSRLGHFSGMEAAGQEPGSGDPCHRLWAQDESAEPVWWIRLSGYLLPSSLLSPLLTLCLYRSPALIV